MKQSPTNVEIWLKGNRALDPREADIVASAIKDYSAYLMARIESLERINASLESARERNLRQIGELTIVLQRHGLMDEAKEAIRLSSEE